MNQSKISVRYAKAFFSLAKEKNLLDTLKQDMEVVAKAGTKSKDFLLFVGEPGCKNITKGKNIKPNLLWENTRFDLKIHFVNC